MIDWTLLSWGDAGWLDEIASGIRVTVLLALCTAPLALLLGFIAALAKQSHHVELRMASRAYAIVFRALPELVTLFLIFFGLPLLLPAIGGMIAGAIEALGGRVEVRGLSIPVSPFFAGWIALGLTLGAYCSEVFASAFKAIPNGQYEGARALGLRPSATMARVIAPQVFRVALPGLSNLWVILVKDTALVSTIGLSETLRQVSVAQRITKEPFLFFGLACLIYLVLTLSSVAILNRWDERLGRGAAR